MALELRNISKSFGGQTAVSNVNLKIENGEFFSLLGSSGCGKTTLMRIISGLEKPDSGEIFLDGVNLTETATQLRPFNMVFQSYALFPHMTVSENIAFGLKMKKLPDVEIKNRVQNVLELINLSDYSSRLPETLSGGQQQRVAVARALVNKPRILLLDEPLSALDKKMREHMQIELKNIQRAAGITFLFVTHDQEEALTMSDKLAIMEKGIVKQAGTPRVLYQFPNNSFSASFLGDMNIIPVEFIEEKEAVSAFRMINGSPIKVNNRERVNPKNVSKIYVRPERLKINFTAPLFFPSNNFEVKVLGWSFKGLYYELIVELCEDMKLKAFVPSENADLIEKLETGARVNLSFESSDGYIFNEDIK